MIISRTPFRISFAGGGSDLRSYYKTGYGAVLSTAINKFAYITANKRFTELIRVGYSQVEECSSVDEIKHNLVREAMKKSGITKGVDVSYVSDLLPAHEGSGLGSSSSITVGTLNALYAQTGKHTPAKKLAREACEIEIDILGAPIGKQDQYAAAYGGLNFIRFNADESVVVTPIIMKKSTKQELQNNLLAFHTGVNTRSEVCLTEQKEKTEKSVNIEALDKMVALAEDLKDALRKGDITQFGEILHKNWLFKKSLASNISESRIDEWYEKAKNAGAIGGKILGSGGGGFLLFYVEPEKQDSVRQALGLRELDFSFEPEGSKIIYVSD
ncbi:GHMP kinase [Candidatus Woesearchaeota archaeon]|nr:GHMP kinase [Candidatus Woesearchaeota archaeon]